MKCTNFTKLSDEKRNMENIVGGIIGGGIPAIIVILIHFLHTEKRMSRLETNIQWLICETKKCRQK